VIGVDPVFRAVIVQEVVCLTETVVGSHVWVSVSGLGAGAAAAVVPAAVALRAAPAAAGPETVSRWFAGRSFVRSGDACAGEEKTATNIGVTSATATAAVFHLVPDIGGPFVTGKGHGEGRAIGPP
jgi:hypothetical protein